MQTRAIGSLQVSLAGLGCANFGWFIDERRSREVIHAALDAGITHFDTADQYGEGESERCLGRVLGARRSQVVITTKYGSSAPPDGSRPASPSWTRRSCEASLARLGTEWIDLYLLHHHDPATPIAETLGALGELQKAGKVREIGCSNLTPEQVAEAVAASEALGIKGFVVIESSYSLLDRTPENTLVPYCASQGIRLLPYFPLGSGMLTGKYRRADKRPTTGRLALSLRGGLVQDYFPALLTDECFDIVESLERYAHHHGRTLLELALSWLASKPYIPSVISGASSVEQLQANAKAVAAWKMTTAEQADIENLTRSDVSYLWLVGSPAYSRPPAGVDTSTAYVMPPPPGAGVSAH
jgi:aryl-alcohol dehydrogenase-like predicted oxidoreductase